MIQTLCKDPIILSQKASEAGVEDAQLAQDLRDTLASIDDAACLAANQIGQAKALFVLRDEKDRVFTMYNPKIMMGLGPQPMEEACLTHEEPTIVKRFIKVKVSYQELDESGETPRLVAKKRDFVGWEAQMVQHMMDHLAGKLI